MSVGHSLSLSSPRRIRNSCHYESSYFAGFNSVLYDTIRFRSLQITGNRVTANLHSSEVLGIWLNKVSYHDFYVSRTFFQFLLSTTHYEFSPLWLFRKLDLFNSSRKQLKSLTLWWLRCLWHIQQPLSHLRHRRNLVLNGSLKSCFVSTPRENTLADVL